MFTFSKFHFDAGTGCWLRFMHDSPCSRGWTITRNPQRQLLIFHLNQLI